MKTLLFLFLSASFALGSPPVPSHSFISKVKEDGTRTVKIDGVKVKENVKKVYWYLMLEGYKFRIRNIKNRNNRVEGATERY